MLKETITLSHLELGQVSVIESIIAKRRRQHEAARQLDLSVRQIKRLVRRYREAFDGTVTLLYKGRPLRYLLLQEGAFPAPLADEKSVSSVVDQARADQARRP